MVGVGPPVSYLPGVKCQRFVKAPLIQHKAYMALGYLKSPAKNGKNGHNQCLLVLANPAERTNIGELCTCKANKDSHLLAITMGTLRG
jgi:hypothetical protein